MLTRRRFQWAAVLAMAPLSVWAKPLTINVLTHSSFDVPKALIQSFETEQQVKLKFIKAGDAGEMLNKLIITRKAPIADVVFGVDNTLLPKTMGLDLFEPYSGPLTQSQSQAKMVPTAPQSGIAHGLVPIDHGYVTINFQKAWFEKQKLALPTDLMQLTQPAYKNLLVLPNPNTSSTGFAFLLATIAEMGEESAFAWWAQMRQNGLKVVKGWTEAYYTDFAQNGGPFPMVVSYATSPAAEVFYSKTKLSTAPTDNLLLKGGVYQQVEGAALIKQAKVDPQKQAKALAFIDWLRSAPVQHALQTTMWMYPAQSGVNNDAALSHSPTPKDFAVLPAQDIAENQKRWLAKFSQVVLR